MAKRITQLTELTTPAADDYIVIVDTSTGTTKKITYRNLVNIPELGWTSAGETWSYASSTTFTVAGVDVTSKYPVGTKLRLKQGGSYKYFYVTATSFSTNTTITVTGGSSYTIANSAITDNYFSYAEVATGFPDGFTDSNGWYLRYNGSQCYWQKRVTFSQTFGGGAVSLTLSSSNLPTGLSTISTNLIVVPPPLVGSHGAQFSYGLDMTTSASALSIAAKSNDGVSRAWAGSFDITIFKSS